MFTYKYKSKKEFNADKNRTSPYVCLIEDTGDVLSDCGVSALDRIEQPAAWEDKFGAMTVGGAMAMSEDMFSHIVSINPFNNDEVVFPDLQYFTSLGWPTDCNLKFKSVILPPADLVSGNMFFTVGADVTITSVNELNAEDIPEATAFRFNFEGDATVTFQQIQPPIMKANVFNGGNVTIRVHEEALDAYKKLLPEMTIETIEGARLIEFKDPCAKDFCNVLNDVYTYKQAADCTSLSYRAAYSDWGDAYAKNPSGIQYFDELKYFTGIKDINYIVLSRCPIKSITIPVNTVQVDSRFLGYDDAYNVVRAVKVTMLPTTPPKIEYIGTAANPIRCMDVKTSVVYVPNESLSLYKADENWGKYNIKPIEND